MGVVTRLKSNNEKRYRILLTARGRQLFESLTVDSLEEVFSVLAANQKQDLAGLLNVLLNRARYLLGISYHPPFLQHLIDNNPKMMVS